MMVDALVARDVLRAAPPAPAGRKRASAGLAAVPALRSVLRELDACLGLGLFEACVCARESPVASALLYLVGVQKSSCKLGARVAVWSPSHLARGCVFRI